MKGLPVTVTLGKLQRLYHPPRTFLHWRTPLDLLVVTVLSAQCTDARVNLVSRALFRKYQTVEDYLHVSRRKLEQDIRSCGAYHNKARFIQELCRILAERHHSKVPQTMEALMALPGVGRKTAAIILYAAFGRNEGIAVDTHVLRLSRRLGLTRETRQGSIEIDLMRKTPRKLWGRLTPLLISHGRAICTARNRRCAKCVFRHQCPSSLVLGRRDLAKD